MKGHVRKRGNKWSFILDTGIDHDTGKRKQKWFSGFKTKKEAEKAMVSKLNELEEGLYVEPSKLLFKDFLNRWLTDYAHHNLRSSTYATYVLQINQHIIPHLGQILLQKLKVHHLQKFYNVMLQSGRKDGSGGLSSETVRSLHIIIRRSLYHAVKWQLLKFNVAEIADPPKQRKKEIVTLSSEEVNRFLSVSKKDRLFIAFLLAVTTGLRRGEILGLRWKDIDWERRTASIQKSLVMVGSKPVLQETKTNSSKRKIYLPLKTIKHLEVHKRHQFTETQTNPFYQDNNLILATTSGTAIIPRNLLRSFYRILKEATLPKIRFHDLRHTHATLMLQQGEHPKIVSERLGHSNTKITMDTYSHVLPHMQQDAVDRFEKMFLTELPDSSF